MLDDFVLGGVGAAALPEDVAVAEGGDGVWCGWVGLALMSRCSCVYAGLEEKKTFQLTFANITEPDVPQRAGTFAVYALELPGTDDDVGDGRAF